MVPAIVVLLAIVAFISTAVAVYGLPKTRPIAKVILVILAAVIIFGLMAMALLLLADQGVVDVAEIRYFAHRG